jgi:hypothetical protein
MKTRFITVLVLAALAFGPPAWAQRTLPTIDHFDYSAGELRSVGLDWTRISGTANDLNVVDGNISYTGYQMPATGRQVRVLGSGADDDKLTFTSQSTAGTKVYSSFILNLIDTLGLNTTGAYFAILGNGTSNFAARLYIRKVSGTNTFNLGVSKNSTTVAAWSSALDVATSHLIVMDYEIVTGTANDTVKVWINPALGGGQPAPALIAYSTGGDLTIDGFFIRQASGNPNAYIDGLRIGLAWSDIDPSVSGGSDVSSGGGTEPASLPALLDSDSEKVLNFDFRVKDDSTGGDALNTLIDKIVITKGTGNDISNWANVIAGAKLFDGSADSATGTVYADSLVFSGIDHSSGKLGEVTDNGSKTYQLKLWLKSDLGVLKTTIDNGNLAFKVDRNSFTVDAAGSPMASGAGTAVESGSANNAVSVTATRLNIAAEPPVSVDVAVDFSLSAEAADSNGNRDLNAANSTTLTLLGGAGNLTSVAGLSQNLSSGIRTWSDLQYDLAESGLSIEASATGLTPDTTVTFSAIGGAPTVQASNLVFSNVSENQMTVSWTSGNGSARIVLIQEGSAVDSDPLDGVSYYPSSTYLLGQEIGTGNYTVYSSSGNSDTILGLAPNTTYHFAVYEYNGSSGTENYLTLSPAVGSQLTTEHFDAGDYRSLKTGNWTDLTAWETYNGAVWGAPSQPPCSTNNIIIRASDTITVNADASCRNAAFLGAITGTRLDIGNYVLSVHGLLNGDGVTLNDYLIRSNSGRLKFVGGQRALFGENWGAYGTRWRMEVALVPGDTGTATKNVKASDIIISSGVFKGQDVRADSGIASTGTLTVNSGASLVARSISRTSTATAVCRKVTVNGTLAMTGSNISADSILINNGAYLRSASVSGQIITGTLQYATGATLEYAASGAQHTKHELQVSVPNIIVNTPAGVTMDTSSTVTNSLTMTSGSLNTGVDSLTLGSSAAMTGEQTGRYVIGKLKTARTVGTGSSDFGGMGVALNAGSDNLGLVSVTRISGAAGQVVASFTGSNADTSIARSWIIASDNPPANGRDLTLSWVSDDDNGRDLTTAKLWKSLDGGASWTVAYAAHDVSSTRSITESVTSFSVWTVSDAANPLPVQLTHFAATAGPEAITISWRTESECQSYLWTVERAAGEGSPYQEMARFQAGNTGQPSEYCWSDNGAQSGQTYYYRLVQTMTDGRTICHGPVSAGLASPTPLSDLIMAAAPNPFRHETQITYLVGNNGNEVSLKVYNISGQLVRTLFEGRKSPGSYSVKWDGRNQQGERAGNGVYVCRLVLGHGTYMKRLTVLR